MAEVRQPAGGVKFICLFNSQHCFPATQRNYVISAIPAHREQGDSVAFFETQRRRSAGAHRGAGAVGFNTDPKVIRAF